MNETPFDDFIKKDFANSLNVTQIPERLRTQASVVLFKRFRGQSLGDRIGRWNYATNNWVEPATDDLDPYNIFTKNIVKKIVRANAATMSQATLAIECSPRQKTTLSKKNALITTKICEDIEQKLWTPARLVQINTLKQLTQGVFVENVWNPDLPGCEYEAEEWQDEEFRLPEQFACPQCGEAVIGGEEDQESSVVCTQCSVEMVAVEDGISEIVPSLKRQIKRQRGDNDIIVHAGLEFRVDEQYSQGANIEGCQWFEHHPLKRRYEIEAEFGTSDIGQASDWSYPMKWLYTLQTGTSYPFKSYKQTQETLKQLDTFEVRYRYYTTQWLASYTAGVDFTFTNANGDVEFEIKAGENARDVVERMAKEEQDRTGSPYRKNCLCVAVTGTKILGIRLADFKRSFKMTYFVSDPVSVWPLAYSELEPMQHLVNQTLTAIGNQVTSNQNVLIVDSEAYDADDVEGVKNVLFTREGLSKPIDDTWGFMPATSVTPDSWRMVDWADMSADEVGMTSKEMQGQPSDARTYGQAQLNRDQSVGVLAPAQQSLGECKATSFLEHCKIAQEHWAFERVRELCNSTDGMITDEDIEAWFRSDLTKSVMVSYRPGSEQPKTYTERQNDVMNVAGFISSLAGAAPNIMTEQLASELIGEYVSYSSALALDLNNNESGTELAEKRYDIITKHLEQSMQQVLSMPPEMMPSGDLMPMVVEQAMSDPLLFPLPQENHAVQRQFYIDKCAAEYLKERPDLMIVMACQQMIERHRQAAIGEGQMLIRSQMEIESAATEPQSAMTAQSNEANAEAQAQQMALETARQAAADELERERISGENYRAEIAAGSQIAQKAIEYQ